MTHEERAAMEWSMMTALVTGADPLAAVSTDALIDELRGRLCPDMGPGEWRDYVAAKGTKGEHNG